MSHATVVQVDGVNATSLALNNEHKRTSVREKTGPAQTESSKCRRAVESDLMARTSLLSFRLPVRIELDRLRGSTG